MELVEVVARRFPAHLPQLILTVEGLASQTFAPYSWTDLVADGYGWNWFTGEVEVATGELVRAA
jgi:hypothetical protein